MFRRSAARPRSVRSRAGFAAALGVLVAMWMGILAAPPLASSVSDVSFEEAVTASDLVFEGVVTSTYYSISPDTGQPFTHFTFSVRDVIKGTFSDQAITIAYLGGPKDGHFLVVSDMRMPKVGESGIYFVESLSRQQVHPLYGWQQWHLLTYVDAAGVTRVRHLERPRVATPVATGANPTVNQVKDAIRATAGQPR